MTRQLQGSLWLVSFWVLLQYGDAFMPHSPVVVQVTSKSLSLYASATMVELENGKMMKTIVEPGTGEPLQLGDIAVVKYRGFVAAADAEPSSSSSTATTTLPFCQSPRQKVVVGDTSMIPAWDKTLRSMTIGERCVVRVVDPTLAYGSVGVEPLIPPNAVIEFDVHVLDAQPATTNIDFDALADAESTPRTAKDIAAAFAVRQAAKAAEGSLTDPNAPWYEQWIAKFKTFYFFGLFEGETGERPPWFLRPSITFPLAFVIVGATFYVTFVWGGIYERGAPVRDELDELLTMTSSPDTAVMMLMSVWLPAMLETLP